MLNAADRSVEASRIRLRVRGIVQGVGFRPFVFRLAHELKLAGWVRNDGEGVEIEAQGRPADLDALEARIAGEAPPRASIDCIEREAAEPDADTGFFIRESGLGPVTTGIGPDSAVCPECLAELFNPADRRWRYPFINCTHCGPRYTLTRNLPWDRASTSMASFTLCPACATEYAAPADRRFHAEPNACPVCGPSLALHDADGLPVASDDPIHDTLQRLLAGEIVAVRGLGGFHLMCDARNPASVARLRGRKSRDAKPFALMVASLASARRWARLTLEEEALLASPERPVVLAHKLPAADAVAPGLAPGLEALGLMLPATPLQYLLFHEAAGHPAGTAWLAERHELALVCTSANPGGEPLVIGNDEALRRLAGIADAFLMHNRDILARCDDSVLRVLPGHNLQPPTPQFIRRARGYSPSAIRLARAGEPVLACGAHFKNTVCLTRGAEAYLSPHIGDLDNPATCQALDEAIAHLQCILAVEPVAVAHDLHPDFYSTRMAETLARELGVPTIAVQHHHAHIAAVLAEHRYLGPALGLALDGVGLGTDGQAWGGELLLVDGAHFERLGSLSELPLPGGDRAAREPWRMGAAALHALGDNADIATRYADQPGAATIAAMLERGLNCPTTTSLGRWFDAAAGLLGVRASTAYEGQAAMELEALAERRGPVLPLPGGWNLDTDGRLDLLPLAAALRRETDLARGAAAFHATLEEALEAWALQAARATGLTTVAFGGGCFLNRNLTIRLATRLAARGLTVLEARQAPPNDGGLALGQAWVALQTLKD